MDIDTIIDKLTLDEKVSLTAGADAWSTVAIDRLGVPSITVSDGPHGIRGTRFFNGEPACLLPAATGMGATFDTELLAEIGALIAQEAKVRGISALLGPTVCLQRSPLIGRGFEAFGEDPILSGHLAAALINGLQDQGVGAVIKHYAAHDQSWISIEDNIRVTQRTLHEVHLMPFQIAVKKSNPWGVMTAYQKINGVHASEHKELIEDVLRKQWGWKGLVMSDWGGTYSTSSAINAGLDLEMPGPTKFRGPALSWAVQSRKVERHVLDERVRNVLEFVDKAGQSGAKWTEDGRNTKDSQSLARRIASQSIVLLKNDKQVLPLDLNAKKRYGLIGDHWKLPAVSGGGSADLPPYYVSKPYDAFVGAVKDQTVAHELGCWTHRFTTLIQGGLNIPDSEEEGLLLEWFAENPETNPDTSVLATMKTKQTYMFLADSLPPGLPKVWFMKAKTIWTAPKKMKFRIGICVMGIGKLLVDGVQRVDLWDSQPEKTDETPMFNSASMERWVDVDVEDGQRLNIEIVVSNVDQGEIVGSLPNGGLRIGGHEVVDEDSAIEQATKLARDVEVPIILTGLSSDWEYEGSDRKSLALPGRSDELIERVLDANPKTSGAPYAMPWAHKASTILHAYFGGQETGNAIADILFGKANPSAKLSQTFPKRIEDNAAFLTFGKVDSDLLYGEGVFIGYRYHEKLNLPSLFYFGYGLSYTDFAFSNLRVPEEFEADPEHSITVTVDVMNVGQVEGAEVVQLYVADKICSVGRPKKELKAFKRINLSPGEKQTVSLVLDRYAIAFWCERRSRWIAEPGEFEVIVSRSADPQDEVLSATFRLSKTLSWGSL